MKQKYIFVLATWLFSHNSLICSNTCQRKELADNQKKYKSPHIHSFKILLEIILCLYVQNRYLNIVA